MYIFKAAVVGAGTMGGEIAQVITYAGLPVVLKDIDQAMLDKGMARARADTTLPLPGSTSGSRGMPGEFHV